ncbi:MAG: metallophosphoesterase [Clostridiales bacterium]|nr:metallophosphoesterase [Clostridiales bacterium]
MARRSEGRLFTPRKKRRTGCITVVVLFALIIGVTLFLNTLSNRFVRLTTRRVTVLNLPRQLERFRILHLSDLNAASLGAGQENLKAALGKEAYQAVVMTGDMVGKGGNIGPMLALAQALDPRVPMLFITGDSDPDPLLAVPHGDGEVKADYIRALEEAGFIYLESPYRLEEEGQVVWFCPGELFMQDLDSARAALIELVDSLKTSDNPYESGTAARLRHAQHRLQVYEDSVAAMAQMQEGDTIVAVMHHPPDPTMLGEMALLYREQEEAPPGPSLFVAGQFNNGQARLPGLGPIYIPPQSDGSGGFFPGDEGFTGLIIHKGYPVHISPGLGNSAYYPIPLRLFNRPQMTLLELTSRMTR